MAFRPSFSGHETFPLRFGWLKKALKDEVKVMFAEAEAGTPPEERRIVDLFEREAEAV